MKKKLDVIIPSATLVPKELQNIGKLPGIIYPVNQRIVFDYLYDQYKTIDGVIDILCYEAEDKVRHRLASYVDKKIQIKTLPKLDDLGHTLYFGLASTNTPILINFADTIIMDDVLNIEGDAIYYSEDHLSETWTFFEEKNGTITTIYDKEDIKSEEKRKMFVGLFLITDVRLFRSCLEIAFQMKDLHISTFYYALFLYSEKKPMQIIKVDNWFDIGHADTYNNSNLEVKAREFNHITIDKNRGILKKTSDDKDKFIGEILWYLKLPTDIEYVRPRIFSYSTSYTDAYVSMEYYAYHTLHELFLSGDLNYNQWVSIFNRIRFVCDDFKRYTVCDEKIQPALEDMYFTKTIQRFNKMENNESFKSFFNNTININSVKYKSLKDICEVLEQVIPEMLYDVDTFHIIHGDLCFANIMIDNNHSFIKVIDPRGKFGTYDIYGDTRYELAKLFHSVDGKYDYIIKDLFTIDYNTEDAVVNYKISDVDRDFDLYELFTKIFATEIGDDLKKIELIEALLFLSMIPLHGESLNHQMAMLGTGIEILNRVVDITEKSSDRQEFLGGNSHV